MAGLRELRKRLKSIRTTGQLAGAMRTAAAAKYSRLTAALSGCAPYAAACQKMLAQAGYTALTRAADAGKGRPCLVVLSGNRGLCGGFNTELTSFFSSLCGETTQPPLLIACGKIAAAYCAEKGLATKQTFPLSDIPSFTEAQALSGCVRALYESGEAASIVFVYQKFVNMLTQTPVRRQLLPPPEDGERAENADTLFLPDHETVRSSLAATCLDAEIYAMALENAAGAQAATLMAMRSAYDNATESAAKLEITINRRRQAEVTASVIETASENAQ